MSQKSVKILDPHLHFFALSEGDYHWLKTENPPYWPDKDVIHHTYLEKDLLLPSRLELKGFVHIEAGFNNLQPWQEIDWLEQHCTLPFRSIAFADLTSGRFPQQISKLLQRKSVVGIRHILDEHGFAILSKTQTAQHLALLAEHNLSFDAQFELSDNQTVNHLIKLATANSSLKIIINHCGMPPRNKHQKNYHLWQANLFKLADCPNIAIKLSGWEMLDRNWQQEWLQQVLQDCLHGFGEKRVMLASNFPVCLLTNSYTELWQKYLKLAENYSADCFDKLTYTNTALWYRLNELN